MLEQLYDLAVQATNLARLSKMPYHDPVTKPRVTDHRRKIIYRCNRCPDCERWKDEHLLGRPEPLQILPCAVTDRFSPCLRIRPRRCGRRMRFQQWQCFSAVEILKTGNGGQPLPNRPVKLLCLVLAVWRPSRGAIT